MFCYNYKIRARFLIVHTKRMAIHCYCGVHNTFLGIKFTKACLG